jgi:signal transduction histidine kinase
LELAAIAQNGSVELHVRDRGPGFPEEFRSRAFERFSRADASQRVDGSGLGLAIVESIALAHRGEAHIENREGGGADAWLALPLVPR